MAVCLSENSKTTPHINLEFCMNTIYDNRSEISYVKLTSEIAVIFTCYFFFSNFAPEANVSLHNQTQPR